MRGFVFILVLQIVIFSLNAQNVEKGVIQDSLSSEPLINTNIYLEQAPLGTKGNSKVANSCNSNKKTDHQMTVGIYFLLD